MIQSGIFHRDVISSLKLWRVWSYLAANDLRGRFARSNLGMTWILLSFAIWAAGVGLVYARLFELKASEFVPFLAVGFALWGFITGGFVESSHALIGSAGYIKQFNLPKQTYINRSVLTQSITLSLNLLVCVVVLAIFGRLTVSGLLFAAPGVALLLLATTLHAYFSAYVTPYIRDFPHAVGSVMSAIFFITPIIFPAEMLEKRGLGMVYHYNPFYYLLEVVREPLLSGNLPGTAVWGGALVYVGLLALMVYKFCRHLDKRLVYAL